MGMNPETNQFEQLEPLKAFDAAVSKHLATRVADELRSTLVRPNGEPVPAHWTVLTTGQHVMVEGYTFSVAHIGESHLLLEPVGPMIVGGAEGSAEGR